MRHRAWIVAAIVALGAALRVPALDRRPMHADEAVHAAKMARLLERGEYRYDPTEFHGPTLNYLTLLAARLAGAVRYQDLDETVLRSVPAAAGLLLVAAHLLFGPVIGFRAAALAALLTAVSPAFVYYSRYYIQEMLLVAFTGGALASLCRYLEAPRRAWAVAAGACLALMFATKETWIIAVGAMAAAFGGALVLAGRRHGGGPWGPLPGRAPSRERAERLRDLGGGILAFVVVSGLFFSSFFDSPRGLVDAVAAYGTYVERATGSTSWHTHPWHYYLGLLLYSHADGGPVWTEGLVLILAPIGGVAALAGAGRLGAFRPAPAFLAIYAGLLLGAYAAIPYKTPWCLLGFLHGLILLAGIGAAYLVSTLRHPAARTLTWACLAVACAHLAWQAWAGSFRYPADPRNPYVYAHTSVDVFGIAERVEALALAHPQRLATPIDVVTRENLWPLPWYFRRLSGVRWQANPVTGLSPAPVVLCTPEVEAAVVRTLYEARAPGDRELYMNIFEAPVELRPQVEVRGYAVKWLWDRVPRGVGRGRREGRMGAWTTVMD